MHLRGGSESSRGQTPRRTSPRSSPRKQRRRRRTWRSRAAFAHARRVTDLLLAIDPTLLPELRDRGLLSYHLDDFPAALRDLEDYLRLNAWTEGRDREEQQELQELQAHVSALRRRVGSLN